MTIPEQPLSIQMSEQQLGPESLQNPWGPLPTGFLVGENSLKPVLVDLFEGTAPFSFEERTNTCHLGADVSGGAEEESLSQTSFKCLLLLSTFHVI